MTSHAESSRLDYLDAVRAFALLLGIVFHASLSFMPVFIGWAVMDVSTSSLAPAFVLVSHSFRMELFFLIAGFFSHLTFHRNGSGSFLKSRLTRIAIPFVVGWFILRPLLVSGWIMGAASLRGDVDVWAGLRGGFESLAALPVGIFTGSHLWFLYYLLLVTGGLLAMRAALRATGPFYGRLLRSADASLVWLAASRYSLLVLAVPTAACLWFMRMWGMDTPDQSLLPHVPATLIYGGFFAFGWALRRNIGALPELVRLSPARWIIAGLSASAALGLVGMQFEQAHPLQPLAHLGFVTSDALMMWSLVFITIGLFKKFFNRPNPAISYLADASYWLYLIHLPIVVWLQIAFAELPLHWSLKLVAITGTTIAAGLLLYDLFVRSTIVGLVLNGRRKPRVLTRPPATAVAAVHS